MCKQTTVKLTLTPEQQQQLQQATARPVTTLKLEALEHRLAPGMNLN